MTVAELAGAAPADFLGLMKRGEEVRAAGDRGAALGLFQSALALEPRSAWARMAVAGALRDAGRHDDADEACRALLADEPRNVGALMSLGHSLRRRGDPAGALPLFQAALGLRPRESWARMAVADTLAELNRFDEAAEACRAVVADEPENVGALMSLGRAANAAADRRAAAEWFGRAARAAPDSAAPRLALADALRDVGDFDAASEAAEAALALEPGNAAAWMSLGHTERRAGRREKARQAFARASELNPGSPGPLVQMAVEERRLGRPGVCARLLERALELDGGDAEALQQLGEHFRLSGELDRAVEAFRRAMALPRPSLWAFLAAGQTLVELGEMDAALRALDDGEARLGATPLLAAKRIELLRRTGDRARARRLAEEASRAWPRHFEIWFQATCLEWTRDGPDACAARLDGAPAGTTLERGRVHALRGLLAAERSGFDEAIEHQTRAIELNPDDGWPRTLLAQARLLTFDTEGAREQLRQISHLESSAAKLQGRSANPSQTHLGQLLDEFVLDRPALEELRALQRLPPAERVAPLVALVARHPDHTAAAMGLVVALRQSGRLARRPGEGGAAAPASRIPRALAQYWDDADPPRDLAGLMRSWGKLYPRYDLRRFDDGQARAFLARFHGADVQAAYRRAREPAQKADIFRLAYLHSRGGYYADADDRLVGDLDDLRFPGADLVLYQEDVCSIGNNFIGAVPGHPLIERALGLAVEAVNRGDGDILWLSTGPGLLTRAFAGLLADPGPGREPLAALGDAVVLDLGEIRRTVSIHCLVGYKSTERHWSRTAFGRRRRTADSGTAPAVPGVPGAEERGGGGAGGSAPAGSCASRLPDEEAGSAGESAHSRRTMSTAASMTDVPIQQALQEIDDEVLAVIRRGLARRTTSFSSFGSIVTGNAYQAVNLRDQVQAGFRRSDPHLFDGIPLEGKRFLDLGCNYGEKTRLAALAGAEYAEGVEYEEYFVRMGGLLSVYNRVPNAVIRQGDITRPGCVRTEFDVGACFSAFVYMRQNLGELLSKIRSMFILETHAMEAGWFEEYVRPVLPAFPYWVLYGFSDHGRGLDAQRRAQIAFARDGASTGLVAIKRAEKLGAGHPDVHSLDVEQSRRAGTLMGNARRSKLLFQDLRASIASLAREDGFGLAELLRGALPAMDELRAAYGQTEARFGTDRYWRVLFEGLVHYLEHRGMTPANPYLVLMRDLAASGQYDSGMKYELEAEDRAIARLGPRLERMIETLLTKRLREPLVVFNPISVPALVREGYEPQDRQLNEHIHVQDRGEYRIQYIDGNHRLAAMWLSGARTCPALPVWTNIFGFGASDFTLFTDTSRHDQLVTPLLSESALHL